MATPNTLPDTPNAASGPGVFLSNMFTTLSHTVGINKMVHDIAEAWNVLGGTNGAAGAELAKTRLTNGSGLGLTDVFSRKSLARNGRFTHWTAATSVTADGAAADDWLVTKGTGGSPAFTVSRQAHTPGAVPGEPPFFLRFNQSAQATSTQPFLYQRYNDVRSEAGQNVTISGRIRCSSGTVTVGNLISQVFGSGGSPSSAVNTAGASITATTTWTRFVRTIAVPSIAGKTIGTTAGSHYLQAALTFPLSSTYTVDISDLKIERGQAATEFDEVDARIAALLLDVSFGNIQNGTAITAATETDFCTNQTFRVNEYDSIVEIVPKGGGQVQSSTVGLVTSRMRIDSAGANTMYPVGGQRVMVNNEFANPFTGSNPIFIAGLSPGDHTVKFTLYTEANGTVYMRNTAYETFSLQVVEHMRSHRR